MPLWCLRLPESVRRRAEQRNRQPCRTTCVSAFKAACAIEIRPRSETEFRSGLGAGYPTPAGSDHLALARQLFRSQRQQVECRYSAGSACNCAPLCSQLSLTGASHSWSCLDRSVLMINPLRRQNGFPPTSLANWQVDDLATIRSSGLPQRNARNGIPRPCGVLSVQTM
jgi:hypothetical protein